MKKYMPIIIILTVVIIAAGAFLYLNQTGQGNKSVNLNPLNQSTFNKNWGPPLGGPCSYDKYQGSCKIISIIKTDASRHQIEVGGGPGYEGFEIKFKYIPKDKLNMSESTKWAEDQILDKEHLLLLINSWYPGPKFLEKYKIKENTTFDCKAEVITEGTCSPVGFEFNDINVSDYFECEKCPK